MANLPSSYSHSKPLLLASAALVTVFTYSWVRSIHSYVWGNKRLRKKLPKTLGSWRLPEKLGGDKDAEEIWEILDPFLKQNELEQWTYSHMSRLHAPQKSIRMATDFAYVGPSRTDPAGLGSAPTLSTLQYSNPTFRVARTKEGHDVTVRPIKLGNEGIEHLKILERVATGPLALLTNNHCLPMFKTIILEDITLGLFPLTADCLDITYAFWARNSVGDVLDMILQALEGLSFLHEQRIAHRDAYKSNFVIQFHPESMRTMTVATSRPRVYIIDFETAIAFPDDTPDTDCVCIGPPVGGTVGVDEWERPLPPEVSSGKSYSPFKLDVWEFGYSFVKGFSVFKSNNSIIDDILDTLVNDDPAQRPSAQEAFKTLSEAVNSIPPSDLLNLPTVLENGEPWFLGM